MTIRIALIDIRASTKKVVAQIGKHKQKAVSHVLKRYFRIYLLCSCFNNNYYVFNARVTLYFLLWYEC